MTTYLLREGDNVVIASHNSNKICEIKALLEPYNISATSAHELGLAEPLETGKTFRENAAIKSRSAQIATGLPSLADDSGLEVNDLNGFPGVYSSDWGGPNRDFVSAMQRVKDELVMKGCWPSEGPVACFSTTLSFSWTDGSIKFFVGKVYGRLVWPPRGTSGFGYDPMFKPDGYNKTFAEMNREEKSGLNTRCNTALSHRARALELFINDCVSKVRTF
ncbi:MAG: dITP/XTP pyrophosphatase [Hyphomicrobiaceae bacterium hypho_1]